MTNSQPNVNVCPARAEWLREALYIVEGRAVSDAVRRNAAKYLSQVIQEARRPSEALS